MNSYDSHNHKKILNCIHHMYSFPWVAMTYCHKQGGLKQQKLEEILFSVKKINK